MHLPAAAWGVAIEIFGWICPLTSLEQELWRRAGSEGFGGGGHRCAAGCEIEGDIECVRHTVVEKLLESLNS